MPQADPMLPEACVGKFQFMGLGFLYSLLSKEKFGAESKSEALGGGTQIYVLHEE